MQAPHDPEGTVLLRLLLVARTLSPRRVVLDLLAGLLHALLRPQRNGHGKEG